MTEPDPLGALLREWKAPEPSAELDTRVVKAFLATLPATDFRPSPWRRFWNFRVSVPAPILLAAMALLVLFFWFRPASAPSPEPGATGVVTRLDATGFEPLPNGETHIVPVKESRQ